MGDTPGGCGMGGTSSECPEQGEVGVYTLCRHECTHKTWKYHISIDLTLITLTSYIFIY